MVRSRLVILFLISFLLVGYEMNYRGNWIDKDGRFHQVNCPEPKDFNQRMRLPQNCTAHVMGVWLDRDFYKNLVLKYTKEKAERKKLEVIRKKQEERIENLELQLKLKIVVPTCPSCNCLPEILTSTLVSTAGCVLWNQIP